LLAIAWIVRAANSNALWRIVHDCESTQARLGRPGKCERVNLAAHYAVLKDLRGRTHFLLLPTARITGIESPALLAPDALNFWQDAWEARGFVAERAGTSVPRDMIGLSINSPHARSQNQLHIHIDCVAPALRQALNQSQAGIGEQWSSSPMRLAGHDYFVLKLHGQDLTGEDPFRLLMVRLSHPATQMADHVLSVIGAQFDDGSPGFYILDSPVGAFGATTEAVLDRSCQLLTGGHS
jgi:CDP-diacylglycerol pyrophosphatase